MSHRQTYIQGYGTTELNRTNTHMVDSCFEFSRKHITCGLRTSGDLLPNQSEAMMPVVLPKCEIIYSNSFFSNKNAEPLANGEQKFEA